MRKRGELVLPGLTALILLPLVGCSGDGPAEPADVTAPAAVTDLRVRSVVGQVVTLAWTAPGDDGGTGTARSYDIRHAAVPVTEGNWGTCTQVSAEPAPAAAGTEQSAAIDTGGRGSYHFALKSSDEASNWSGLSNVVTASTAGGAFVVHQLTTGGKNDDPHVDGGFVVWVHSDVLGSEDIYIANLESPSPAPERLTDDGGEKGHPNNHGRERIVWERRAGTSDDWEIWLYDLLRTPRTSQFTDNDVPDLYPDLAGGGDFAWLQGRPMFESVHYWNESLHAESTISEGCCPTSTWSNEIPSADDHAVVWRSYDRAGSGGFRAYLWRGTLTDISGEIEAQMTIRHSLHAGGVAYEHGAGPTIRYWDGATVHDVGQGFYPCAYAGTVVYEASDGHDREIRYWDGSTTHAVTDNDFDDTRPSLHGSIIVWTGRPPGGSDQIFYVNMAE